MATADWLTTAPRGIRIDGVYRCFQKNLVFVLQFHALQEPVVSSCVSFGAMETAEEDEKEPVCESSAYLKSKTFQLVRPIGNTGWLAGPAVPLDQYHDHEKLQDMKKSHEEWMSLPEPQVVAQERFLGGRLLEDHQTMLLWATAPQVPVAEYRLRFHAFLMTCPRSFLDLLDPPRDIEHAQSRLPGPFGIKMTLGSAAGEGAIVPLHPGGSVPHDVDEKSMEQITKKLWNKHYDTPNVMNRFHGHFKERLRGGQPVIVPRDEVLEKLAYGGIMPRLHTSRDPHPQARGVPVLDYVMYKVMPGCGIVPFSEDEIQAHREEGDQFVYLIPPGWNRSTWG